MSHTYPCGDLTCAECLEQYDEKLALEPVNVAHEIATDYAKHLSPEAADLRGDFYWTLSKAVSDTRLRDGYASISGCYYHAADLVRRERAIAKNATDERAA